MGTDEPDLFDHHSHRRHKEPSFSHSNTDGGSKNFEFAFNSVNFSDRVLKIEIVAEGAAETESYAEGCCSSIADWARHRKRRREEIKKDHAAEFAVYKTDSIVNANPPDINGVAYEKPDGEAVVMIEESPSGDEPSCSSDFSWSMDCSPVLRVNEVHISSAILAAESPFFYKLFSNGMRESDQKHATLRISASEEAALMELLSFIYSGKLSYISAPLVLDVLMAADKFEVASCMRYCSQLLRSQSMTTESALVFLELPSSVSMASAVQPLTDAAKEFLANKYRDLSESQDELMNFPLAGIEAVLSSDILQAATEDAVYDFVLKWARARYGKVEERREIMGSCLGRLVRFSYMSSRKLLWVLKCNDLGKEIASKVVLQALVIKYADTAARQRVLALLASRESPDLRRFVERAYKYRPVKVVEFELPHPQCIVYLDLKREECANLFPSGGVYSQAFYLGGQGFYLWAHCNVDQPSRLHCFGLFLWMVQEEGKGGSVASFTVEFEFAARTRPAGDFVSKYPKAYCTFTSGKATGYRNLFAIPWDAFLAEDSLYFINGILHLRAQLTIKQQQQPLV